MQPEEEQNLDDYIENNMNLFDRTIESSKLFNFIEETTKKIDQFQNEENQEEKFDPLELGEIESSLENLNDSKMTFSSISNLFTLSLFYEDLFHGRESVVQQTVCNSAVNKLDQDVNIYSHFVENLKMIQNSSADIIESENLDDEILSQIGNSISTFINDNAIPMLNHDLSELEYNLGLSS